MNQFEEMIIRLEQEIRDLKTARPVAANLRAFTSTFRPSTVGRYKITYAAGGQPIITSFYPGYSIALGTPSGNVQYIWAFYASEQLRPTVVSTRQILSIEYAPE